MYETFRSGIDGISGDKTLIPGIGAQVVRQPVRNMRQEAQGCCVSGVVTCYG